MSWLSAVAAPAKVFAAILDLAREAQARGAGRAEAIAEASTHALDLIPTPVD